ncbi:MAG TPA: oligosaccharide flippase family protein, partial [Candidatus Dormibacteraeota bacterium]|nr:oligosaccharide flippase family protein [Candidatus Dormibacteraeota bacterium]
VGFLPAAMIPVARLQRDLSWWRQRLVDVAGPLAGVVVTLPLAIAGAGVWSLVAGQLASMCAQTLVLWVRAPRRPRLLRRLPPGALRQFLDFGIPLWAAGVLGAVAINVVMFTVATTIGLVALGFFRIAASLGDRIDRAELVLTQVLFPVLCRVRDEARLRRAFVLSSRLILLWAVPAGVGLAVFAPEITHLVLGGTWEHAPPGSGVGSLVPLLRVEGLGEVLNAIATTWAVYYEAAGRTRAVLPMTVAVWTSMVAGSAILGHLYGYGGLVATLAITGVVGLVIRRRQMRLLFPGIAVLGPCLPLLAAGGAAAGAALLAARPLPGLGAGATAARVAIFLGVYGAIAVIAERGTLRETLQLARTRPSR